VSVLLDTDLLSLLERKRIPAKLAAWIAEQNDLVVSVVSLCGAGIRIAASASCPSPSSCQLACRDAAEVCTGDRGVDRADPGSLEGTPCRSQEKKADDDVRGFVDSRYSLVSWS
jgi:hypothetical protein